MSALLDLPDPRVWPDPAAAPPGAAALHGQVRARLALTETQAAERADARIDAVLADWLVGGDGKALATALDTAPAADVYRHLWRRVAIVEPRALTSQGLAAVLFALPLVIVTGREQPGEAATVAGALSDAEAVVALLREHGAVDPRARVGLAPALVATDALMPASLPGLVVAARAMLAGAPVAPLPLSPAAMRVEGTAEAAHLRFLVGIGLCAPDASPLGADATRAGMPLTRALSRQLAVPGVTVLALAGTPQRLVPALAAGRALQRQVALQLFATHALRRLRASFGEPTAVISAHVARDAPGGGELRVSLASPFGPRDAEGFRYPLQPYERVPDALGAITALLHDCRVANVLAMPGVQPDRDPATGLLRFCREADVERKVH